jgi:hypothetical protein
MTYWLIKETWILTTKNDQIGSLSADIGPDRADKA